MSKYTTMAVALFVVTTGVMASPLKCTVTSTTGNGMAAFGGVFGGPSVGETTEIDPTVNEITSLQFSKGGDIPLENINAKLIRLSANYFEGSQSTPFNDYTGILRFNGTRALIQVLRKSITQTLRRNPLDLLTIGLDCQAK